MLRSLFVLTLVAVGLCGGVASRFLGLLTYVFIAVFRPVEWIWWDIRFLRLSLVSGLLLLIPSLASGIGPNLSHPLSLGTWAFVALAVVAQATTYVTSEWAWIDQLTRLVIVSGLAVTLLNSRQRIGWYVLVLGSSIGFYSAKAGVVAMTGGGVSFAAGQAGSFADNNGYAVAINIAIPLMAACISTIEYPAKIRSAMRGGLMAALPLSALTIIGTGSRGGFLALVVVSLGYAMLQRRSYLWVSGLVVVGALIWVYGPKPQGYAERLSTIQTYEEVDETSALGRIHFWKVAGEIASENPLGVGLGNYPLAYDRYDFSGGEFGNYRAVHSSHFQILAELGYAGVVVWAFLLGYSLFLMARIRWLAVRDTSLPDDQRSFYVTMSTGLLASMTAFIVGGAFIALAGNDMTWLSFAAITAVDRNFKADLRAAAAPRDVTPRDVASPHNEVPRRAQDLNAIHVRPRPRRAATA